MAENHKNSAQEGEGVGPTHPLPPGAARQRAARRWHRHGTHDSFKPASESFACAKKLQSSRSAERGGSGTAQPISPAAGGYRHRFFDGRPAVLFLGRPAVFAAACGWRRGSTASKLARQQADRLGEQLRVHRQAAQAILQVHQIRICQFVVGRWLSAVAGIYCRH